MLSGVDLQSKVKSPVFNPSISQGDSSCKEAVELLRGNQLPFILGGSLPVLPAKLVKRIIKGDYLEMLSDNMEMECQWV